MPEVLHTGTPMVKSTGELTEVPKEELAGAEALGYRPATSDDLREEAFKQKYGTESDKFHALVEGGLDAVPFVGGFIQNALGMDPEAREAHKQLFPGLRQLGAVSSIALQAAAPISPVSIIGKAGRGVAGLSESLVPQVLGKAAGGATAGALFNAGQAVNEATLGDPNLTLEKAMAQVGVGALIGGATGGLFGLAEVPRSAEKGIVQSTVENLTGASKWLKYLAAMHHPGILIPEAFGTLKELAKDVIENPEEVPFIGDKLSAFKVLKPITDLVKKTDQAVKSGVKAVFSSAPLENAVTQGAASFAKEQERFTKARDLLSSYSHNPENLTNTLSSNTDTMYEHAPNITMAANRVGVSAVQALLQALPNNPLVAPLADNNPTPLQIKNFNRLAGVLNNPLSLLHQIRDNSINQNHVSAMKAVYPTLYQDIANQLTLEIGGKGREIPYQTRLGLSKFLGTDLDGSSNPLSIASNQATFQAPSLQNPQDQAGPVKPTQTGLSKLKIASRIQTPLQKTNERRNE